MKFTILPALSFVALAAADTLQVHTFADTACGDPLQTFTLGNQNECHQAATGFASYTTSNVAQSFFNKGIRLEVWSTNNCEHSSITEIETVPLSNAGGNCHVAFAGPNQADPENPFKGFSFEIGQFS